MAERLNREQVFAGVQQILVDALGVDEEEVVSKATLSGDLEAESIDYLDIVFRLERVFGIKIPREEIYSNLYDPQNRVALEEGLNRQTAQGQAAIRRIREKQPERFDGVTVDHVVDYVMSKLSK